MDATNDIAEFLTTRERMAKDLVAHLRSQAGRNRYDATTAAGRTLTSGAGADPAPDLEGGPMHHRFLGRTGVSVSKLRLGAMMFGAWGESDHDESIRVIHAALPRWTAASPFIDTADVYSAG